MFITDNPQGVYAFIQWKGTDACFDFYCECGRHLHYDGDFAYVVNCPGCGALWEMPVYLFPRKPQGDALKYHKPIVLEES